MTHDVDAIYDHGVFRPLSPLGLPDGARVRLHVEEQNARRDGSRMPFRIMSPRLVHPEQASEFTLEVQEAPDAGL